MDRLAIRQRGVRLVVSGIARSARCQASIRSPSVAGPRRIPTSSCMPTSTALPTKLERVRFFRGERRSGDRIEHAIGLGHPRRPRRSSRPRSARRRRCPLHALREAEPMRSIT